MADKSKFYEKIEFLGEGQFAMVYKARDVANNDRIVAVKKIKVGNRAEAADGINRTALREIKLLQELAHPNVIGLLDVFGHRSNVSLVFDFMDTDLEVLIKDSSVVLSSANIKSYVLQTLLGLEYLHNNWVLHRDLKPNNLLINRDGVLKIGDFGLAKFYGSPTRVHTHQVVTRWYRAPELLLGARAYGTGVDLWAVGCILAELLLRIPLLPGDTDIDQLTRIFTAFGTPTDENWPSVKMLPDYIEFKPIQATPLESIFTAASHDLMQLLIKLFALDPLRRCTSSEALRMAYFSNRPAPSLGSELPLPRNLRPVTTSSTSAVAGKRKALDLSSDSGGLRIKKLVF